MRQKSYTDPCSSFLEDTASRLEGSTGSGLLKSPKGLICTIYFLTTLYAVLRYNVMGNVDWSQLPLFIINKTLAFTGFLLLLLGFVSGALNDLDIRLNLYTKAQMKTFGKVGFYMIIGHVIISAILLKSSYYQIFFSETGQLTFLANISILAGVLAFLLLRRYGAFIQEKRHSKKRKGIIGSEKFSVIISSLVAIHLFFMDYKGWLTPDNWHGGLPPITLLCFIAFVISTLLLILGKTAK